MTSRATTILEQALDLTVEERAEVAAGLLSSLDGPPDEGAEQAWNEEVIRRAEQVASGTAELVAWEDVRSELSANFLLR